MGDQGNKTTLYYTKADSVKITSIIRDHILKLQSAGFSKLIWIPYFAKMTVALLTSTKDDCMP